MAHINLNLEQWQIKNKGLSLKNAPYKKILFQAVWATAGSDYLVSSLFSFVAEAVTLFY